MAPPPSRRSKQSSSPSPPSPIPLPGIALGIFAAIAAGFAASRLRRKRPVIKNLQDEQPATISAGNLLVQDRELEIKEKDDLKASSFLFNVNGTIGIASPEPAKLAADLKTVFDCFEEVSLLQKNCAKPVEETRQEEEEEEEEGVDEFQEKNGASTESEAEKRGKDKGNDEREAERVGEDEGDEEKKAEALENGKEISGDEGGVAEITVKNEASLVADEASMETLQVSLVVDDGDDDRSSADQQPVSPVLINGRILDFLEEMSDSKDDPDLLPSRSNSLSDAVSESSMQEISSMPVKPFEHAAESMEASEEAMEAAWTTATKPDFVGMSNQSGHEVDFSESRNCSDVGKNLQQREEKLLEIEENLKPFESDVVVAGVVLDLRPVTVEIEEEDLSVDKVNQIKFEVICDVADVKGDQVVVKDEISIIVHSSDERFAEPVCINGKVPYDDLPFPKEHSESKSVDEGEHMCKVLSDDLPLPEELSNSIAVDEGEHVHKVLSDDLPLPEELSESEAVDEGEHVRKVLSDDLPLPEELSESEAVDEGEHVLKVLSYDSPLPEELSECKAVDEGEHVRKVLSDDLPLPEELSESEAVDEGEHVRKVLSEEPSKSEAVDEGEHVCKVLSDEFPLPEELSESKAVDEGEHVLHATKEGSDDSSGLALKDNALAESVRINSNSLSDDSEGNCSLSEAVITGAPIRQLGQEMSNGTVSGIHGSEPQLPVTKEVSGEDDSSVNCVHEGLSYTECVPMMREWSLQLHSESTGDLVCLESNASEELLNADGILEELVLQSGEQNLDVVDGTSAVVSEDSVIAQEQPSSLIASSKENTEDYEHDSDASTCNEEGEPGSGRKDDDGLVDTIRVEGRVHHATKQQEIEEITRSDEANNYIFELKKSAFSTDSVHLSNDSTREVQHFDSKGSVHEVGLQVKGGFLSGSLKYLPLEIGLLCLLIALVSYVLWYLEVSSPVP